MNERHNPQSFSAKLTEAQQMALVRASQNDNGELIKLSLERSVGSSKLTDGFGSSANDLRMIKRFFNKGLVQGDLDDVITHPLHCSVCLPDFRPMW